MTLAIADGLMLAAYRHTKITPDQIRSRKRDRQISRPRQAIAAVLCERTDWSLPRIAGFVGLTDHTTVRYARDQASKRAAKEPEFAELIALLRATPAIMPGVLAVQIGRVDAGLEPLPANSSEIVTASEVRDQIFAEMRAKDAAQRAREAVEAARNAERRRLFDDVNDCGIDWATFDWQSGDLDDDGMGQDDISLRTNIMRGSIKLRRAIELARAA